MRLWAKHIAFWFLLKSNILDIVCQILDFILHNVLRCTSFDELANHNIVFPQVDEPHIAEELTSVETFQPDLSEQETTDSPSEQSEDETNENDVNDDDYIPSDASHDCQTAQATESPLGDTVSLYSLAFAETTKSFFEQSVAEYHETQRMYLKIGLLRHVQLIGQHFSRLFPNTRLYFLLHNIDAPHLRSYDTQLVLAHLAEMPMVHFLTSIDDPNAIISLCCTL